MKETTNFTIEQREQPHDRNTERVVLATLMRRNEEFDKYSDLLSSSLFYHETEKAIYKTIEGVITGGGITDVNSLYAYAQSHQIGMSLDRQDFLDIIHLSNVLTLRQDIERLRRLYRQRATWLVLQQAAANVLDPLRDIDADVNGVISALGAIQGETGDDGISTFADAINELRSIVQDNATGKHTFLRTWIDLFDDYYLLRPDTLTVIAAFTSVGKSALAMNIAVSVAKSGIGVAYYSLEMGKAELASRALSKAACLSASQIMNKRLDVDQQRWFEEAAREKERLPIYIDERSTVSFERTIRSIRTMAKKKNVKLAIIDYLQIYTQNSDSVEASLAAMARDAKNIAKELGIAVVLLSQLNRSGMHPSIKMLRGSGQIEESADNIVLIDRPDAYPDNSVKSYKGEFSDKPTTGTAKLILAKGRGVGTGCRLMYFDGRYAEFYPYVENTDSDSSDDEPF